VVDDGVATRDDDVGVRIVTPENPVRGASPGTEYFDDPADSGGSTDSTAADDEAVTIGCMHGARS